MRYPSQYVTKDVIFIKYTDCSFVSAAGEEGGGWTSSMVIRRMGTHSIAYSC